MTVTIGILGLAHSHVGMYVKQWQARPELGVQVAAVWDHDATRAAEQGLAMSAQVCASSAALLARPEVQAVVIGAETSHHAALVEQAAAAGKAIVLQKPLALTLDEAERMVAAVERHQVPFTLAWQMRVDPQNLLMKQMVQDGVLGRVYMVRRRHGLSTHVWKNFHESWHVKPELNRGMWADDASHAVDFLLWLLGEPQSVMAEIATLRDPRVPDDHGVAVYRYADGLFAEVCSSFTCVAGENTTEIVGERGVLIQNFGDGPSCNVPRPAGAPGVKWYLHEAGQWQQSDLPTPSSHGARIGDLAQPLAEFLHGQRAPLATVEEGRQALRMIEASYRAAATGQRVWLSSL